MRPSMWVPGYQGGDGESNGLLARPPASARRQVERLPQPTTLPEWLLVARAAGSFQFILPPSPPARVVRPRTRYTPATRASDTHTSDTGHVSPAGTGAG